MGMPGSTHHAAAALQESIGYCSTPFTDSTACAMPEAQPLLLSCANTAVAIAAYRLGDYRGATVFFAAGIAAGVGALRSLAAEDADGGVAVEPDRVAAVALRLACADADIGCSFAMWGRFADGSAALQRASSVLGRLAGASHDLFDRVTALRAQLAERALAVGVELHQPDVRLAQAGDAPAIATGAMYTMLPLAPPPGAGKGGKGGKR